MTGKRVVLLAVFGVISGILSWALARRFWVCGGTYCDVDSSW